MVSYQIEGAGASRPQRRVAQTKDTKLSAVYDKDSNKWIALDNGTYRNSIKNGIKMANKQATIDVMTLPIAAPGVAK